MTRLTASPRDAEIRQSLRAWLLREHRDDSETVVVDELGLCRGQVRVDIAVVNGLLHGYEIKSDRDSFRRLGGQLALYNRVLDRVTLVVGGRHLARAMEIAPQWWGVLRVTLDSGVPRFKSIRKGRRNPTRDPRALVELLWLDAALALLVQRNAARGVRGKPREIVWNRVCEYFSTNEIAAAVRTHLKARAEQRVAPARS